MRIGSEMGLRVVQTRLDIIGNNIANANTPGFKAGEMNFDEALHGALGTSEPLDVEPERRYSGKRLNMAQGTILESGIEWHMAIEGQGFFQVRLPDGRIAYTRAGDFQLDAAGNLVTPTGALLNPPLCVPQEASDVQIQPDGTVIGTVDEEKRVLGQVQLALFANPDGLEQIGDNLFMATESSGPAQIGSPGSGGFGSIRGGALESSNVNLAVEMGNLLQAQREYQLHARLIRHDDQLYQQANQLRR